MLAIFDIEDENITASLTHDRLYKHISSQILIINLVLISKTQFALKWKYLIFISRAPLNVERERGLPQRDVNASAEWYAPHVETSSYIWNNYIVCINSLELS